jgi:hypothetical protein
MQGCDTRWPKRALDDRRLTAARQASVGIARTASDETTGGENKGHVSSKSWIGRLETSLLLIPALLFINIAHLSCP